jgi:hypothetical protein
MFRLYILRKMIAWFFFRESVLEVSFRETILHLKNYNSGKAKLSQQSKMLAFELQQVASLSSEAPPSNRLHPTSNTLRSLLEARADRASLQILLLLSSLSRRLSPKFPWSVSSRWTWSGLVMRQLPLVTLAAHLKIMSRGIWPWILKPPRGSVGHPCLTGSDDHLVNVHQNSEWDQISHFVVK